MKRWLKIVAVLVLSQLLTGCALFSSPAALPVALNALDHLATLVKKETGKELQDVPMSCTHENEPVAGELLMLCTVCYKLEAGETCK